eukprot:COSAG02_NODE_67363_length_253_cov_0.668831_1_plen_72_part_01
MAVAVPCTRAATHGAVHAHETTDAFALPRRVITRSVSRTVDAFTQRAVVLKVTFFTRTVPELVVARAVRTA